MTRFPLFWAARAVLAFAALAAGPVSAQNQPAPALSPRVISNTASASWDVPGGTGRISSNRLDIPLEGAAIAAISAQTFRRDPNGPASTPLGGARCALNGTMQPMGGASDGSSGGITRLSPASRFDAGEIIVFELTHPAANRDPASSDSFVATVTTDNGDRETLTLVETGANSGIFAGYLPTIGGETPVVGDCRLTVSAAAPLLIRFHDGSNAAVLATVVAAFAQPSAVSAIAVTKAASSGFAEPGDAVRYEVVIRNEDSARPTGAVTVTDELPPELRLRADTLRLDGRPVRARSNGRRIEVGIGLLPPNGRAVLTYLAEVLAGAREGPAVNRVHAADDRGVNSNVADVAVRIARERISGRMTITGRVTEGRCPLAGRAARGLANVRVMLEDGSYAVSDQEGRYHFEGVLPGIHVVQMDDGSLPPGFVALDCARDTRSGGSSISRFVEGGGGSHKRVDFSAIGSGVGDTARAAMQTRPAVLSDAQAAGADKAWLDGQTPGISWLFPGETYNPRARVMRVAIKHLPGQTVTLRRDGKPVDALAFDGVAKSGDGTVAVSVWRGVPIEGGAAVLSAEVRNANGSLAQSLTRTVHFTDHALRAELVPALSRPVADGVTRPVIAVRLTGRDGRPVHHGAVGEFTLPAPYLAAVEADAQTRRQLSGLERAQAFWRVEGDEGIAFIELEPTTQTGTLAIQLAFRDGEVRRDQRLELWLDAGNRPWTIVGFASGTLGFNTLRSGLEGLGRDSDKLALGGRVALYAKGRVRGKWLLTLAYDSAKREEQTRFAGTIDPEAYYTIYADRSERRYDAASLRKLYVKLERPQFFALFGDYDTGLTEAKLTRYARSFNGLKAEYRGPRFAATAFAADAPTGHRREEIQGNGLSGPYALAVRQLLPNSEIVQIETRDRFRSNLVLETRRLSRHLDYDIDYLAGTLRFKEPILSRASGLDPQFIVVDYEVDGVAEREINAGGRVSWRSAGNRLQIGAAAVRDKEGDVSATVAGVDVRYRPSPRTEIRAELAASRGEGRRDVPEAVAENAAAWLVEAEHHGARYDLLAYAREQEQGFGTGQVNAAENGTRKFGLDGRLRLSERLSLTGSAWHETYLNSDARRVAGRALLEYRTPALDLRGGLVFADDRLADGRRARSTLVQLGGSRRFLDGRLELDGSSEFAVAGDNDSIDFPARHQIGARFALTPDIGLVGAYEIADGETIDARTARLGFDLKPWAGARFALTGNLQDIAEYGPRSFAAYGLSQSLPLGKRWTVDFSLDGNKTLGGIDPARVLNPLHPVASGGFIGNGRTNTLTEDFTALTASATYRGDKWSMTGRAEYRDGDEAERYGITAAALRQIGEGRALGGAVDWHVARSDIGAETRAASLQLSWAHRPAASRLSWLNKLELRDDRVSGAIAGLPGPIGGAPLLISGDARSRRAVNSLSVNWTPLSDDGRESAEVSLFWGARYASERFGADDVKGLSNIVGGDLRWNLSDTLDAGVSASLRHGAGARGLGYAVGPNLGLSPAQNSWISIGWNLVGFADRDFEEARYTRSGPYVTARLKFDQLSLGELLGSRARAR